MEQERERERGTGTLNGNPERGTRNAIRRTGYAKRERNRKGEGMER